jgi:hypothetical protein
MYFYFLVRFYYWTQRGIAVYKQFETFFNLPEFLSQYNDPACMRLYWIISIVIIMLGQYWLAHATHYVLLVHKLKALIECQYICAGW